MSAYLHTYPDSRLIPLHRIRQLLTVCLSIGRPFRVQAHHLHLDHQTDTIMARLSLSCIVPLLTYYYAISTVHARGIERINNLQPRDSLPPGCPGDTGSQPGCEMDPGQTVGACEWFYVNSNSSPAAKDSMVSDNASRFVSVTYSTD